MRDSRRAHTPSTSLPIVGVLPEILRERRNLHNLFLRYATEAREAGKALVWLGQGPLRRMLLVVEPVVADEIMRSPHFADRTSFPIIDATYALFIGATGVSANMGGITFVNGAPWRRNRDAALRCLSRPGFLDTARAVTQACADRLLSSWQGRGLIGTGARIDLGREMSRLAIDIMGQLCWRADLGAIDGDHQRFFLPVNLMLDAIQRYIYVPLPASVVAILPTPTLIRLRAAVRRLRAMGDGLMTSHLDESGRLRVEGRPDDVLGFLLRELVADAGAPAKDELDNVQGTLMDLLGAGHDTTANAMAFCLGLLAQPANARWQARAAQEAQRAAGDAPVLTAAYRETLRLYPLGAMFSRVASSDTTLSAGGAEGMRMPRGTQVLVSPYVMGRDPREWSDVTRFRPERHLAQGGCPHLAKLRAPAYAPYGGGKRSCVGAHFAEAEAQAALGRILRAVRLTLVQGDEPIEADLLFTMRPRRQLWARAEARGHDAGQELVHPQGGVAQGEGS